MVMPPRQPTLISQVDWDTYLAGADPYLVWADLSDFRGFTLMDDRNGKRYAVAIETLDADPPLPDPKTPAPANGSAAPVPANPAYVKVCSAGAGLKGSIYTALVGNDELKALIESRRVKLELNLPRYNTNNAQAGPDDQQFADPDVILKKSVIAIIDNGCPFAHAQFRSGDQSRIAYLWDQDPWKTARLPKGGIGVWNGRPWFPVERFLYGRELTRSNIAALLRSRTNSSGQVDEDQVYIDADYEALESRRTHGSHVLDMAVGRINPLTQTEDAASQADIIFVQLPRSTVADSSGGSMTKYVLDALTYIFDKTKDVDNLVINMSYGSAAGPHDGSSMLERAMDQIMEDQRAAFPDRKLEMVLPAGNHFLLQGHTSVCLDAKTTTSSFFWEVMPDDPTDSFLELWYAKGLKGNLAIEVISPSKETTGPVKADSVCQVRSLAGELVGAVVHSMQTPNGENPMALIALAPTHPDYWSRTEHGVWTVNVSYTDKNGKKPPCEVMAWVERDDPLPGQNGQPQSRLRANRVRPHPRDPDFDVDDDLVGDGVKRRGTGNSLANGKHPIVVGACVQSSSEVSSYSAADSTFSTKRKAISRGWPDVLAFGDESEAQSGILAAGTRSGVSVRMNGTSVAAPQVARHLINLWAGSQPIKPVAPRTKGARTTMLAARGG